MSVVVPVYNHREALGDCLSALSGQTYPADRYEVVVVDNGSDEPIADLVAQHPRARLLRETRPGSYAARNAGVAHARGALLAFTDADCVPAPDWIEQGVRCVSRPPEAAPLAGRIDVIARSPDAPNAVELYQIAWAFPQEETVRLRHYGPTANLFVHRSLFEQLGGFNPKLKSGGDRDFGQRALAAGHAVRYAEEVRITHRARTGFQDLFYKVARVVGGERQRALEAGRRRWPTFAKAFAYDLLPPIGTIRKAWRRGEVQGLRRRLQIAGVCWFVKLASASERVRLELGGAARRR